MKHKTIVEHFKHFTCKKIGILFKDLYIFLFFFKPFSFAHYLMKRYSFFIQQRYLFKNIVFNQAEKKSKLKPNALFIY